MPESDAVKQRLTALGKSLAKAVASRTTSVETAREAIHGMVKHLGPTRAAAVLRVASDPDIARDPISQMIIGLEEARLKIERQPQDTATAWNLGFCRSRLAALMGSTPHSEELIAAQLLGTVPQSFTVCQKELYLSGLAAGASTRSLSKLVLEVAHYECCFESTPKDPVLMRELQKARARLKSVRSRVSLRTQKGVFRAFHEQLVQLCGTQDGEIDKPGATRDLGGR